MNDLNKEIFKATLNCLSEKRYELTKILLHKVTYFLKESGIPITYRFTPYTYGPFSFDLMNEMNEMVFWEEIEVDGKKSFKITSSIEPAVSSALKVKIEIKIKEFFALIDEDTTFGNLELYGTAIYCYKALLEVNDAVDYGDFHDEFTSWKGREKYLEKDIRRVYSRLENVL